jgi:large subunit ribosomal protein L19e
MAMADLKYQKRLAADLLNCGYHRVKFDWQRIDDVAEAVTRSDIRKLIVSGAIFKAQKKGTSRGRRGHGKRKGSFKARNPKKELWIMTIRPIRRRLRNLREKGKIDKHVYRTYYRQAKGGMFKSKSHLNQQLKMRQDITAKKKIKKKGIKKKEA